MARISDYNCLSTGFVGSRRNVRVKCDLVSESSINQLERPLSVRKIPRHSIRHARLVMRADKDVRWVAFTAGPKSLQRNWCGRKLPSGSSDKGR